MANWRNTFYYEVADSPNESYKLDESGADRRVLIADAALVRRQAVVDFVGYSSSQYSGSANYISRQIPHPYPTQVNINIALGGGGQIINQVPTYQQALYCSDVPKTTPKGAMQAELVGTVTGPQGLGRSIPDLVELQLHYQTFPYRFLDDTTVVNAVAPAYAFMTTAPGGTPGADNPLLGANVPDEGGLLMLLGYTGSRYIVRQIRPVATVRNLRSGFFYFCPPPGASPTTPPANEDCRPTPEPLTITESMLDVAYTWVGVPEASYPITAIKTYLGCVNGVYFDSFPVGTLLFLNSTQEMHIDVLGQRVYNITHHFRYVGRIRRTTSVPALTGVPLGWNAIPRSWSPTKQEGNNVWDWELLSAIQWNAMGVPTGSRYNLAVRPYRYCDFSRLFRPDQNYQFVFMDLIPGVF